MKFVLATGGSGGHIFPALSTAEVLKSRGHEVCLAGAFGRFEGQVRQAGYEMLTLPARGWAGPAQAVGFASAMMAAAKQTHLFFADWRPDAVLGFGSYGAVAPMWTAIRRRCPVMIHEQNVVPGKANRWLSRWAKKVAVSFEEGRAFFPEAKTVVTGCPVRARPSDLTPADARHRFDLKEDLTTVLVLGGSQGSRRLNDAMRGALPLLKTRTPVQVIHLAGRDDARSLAAFYTAEDLPHAVLDFCDDMPAAYAAADVVVARAGAVTITEIALFQCPAVLIPYPFAGGHQRYNADVLAKRGAAAVIEENILTPERLSAEIASLGCLTREPEDWARRLEGVARPAAAQDLAQTLEALA